MTVESQVASRVAACSWFSVWLPTGLSLPSLSLPKRRRLDQRLMAAFRSLTIRNSL
jgi:hypothetical protein